MRNLVRVLLFVSPLVIASSCGRSTLQEATPEPPSRSERDIWQARAQQVSIIRDDWGIPHVRGRTDADAVFALMYAQAEDDFNRVETNFLLSQGRLAEAEGEKEIWRDLRMRLFIDPAEIKRKYLESPEWLRQLMDAWADGLNYFLATHAEVKPRVITRFEPWMALTFSEGSIGGDIERVSLKELEAFYGADDSPRLAIDWSEHPDYEPKGSNGIAIAPANSKSKHALLWINPHTSFFFRTEAQVTSEEGLNAYGALTWGQFFVYQGFNEHAGWMHTSSGVDNIDEYLETVIRKGDSFVYQYGTDERALAARETVIRFKTQDGMSERKFTTYRSHHGPIVRATQGKWVSIRLMEDPVRALTQSFARTKAKNLPEFMEIMNLHANSSNNTVFADSEGNIAYFHSNFIPKRRMKFDWTKPVDGSDPETEWGEVLSVDASPNAVNPKSGWVYNTNNPPWTAAGPDSPKQGNFPAYVETFVQNPRGVHAIQMLSGGKDFSIDSLIRVAFDARLPEFDVLLPPLFKAYDALAAADPLKLKLTNPIAQLRKWNRQWAGDSVPTMLAVLWAEESWNRASKALESNGTPSNKELYEYIEKGASARERLDALATVIDTLNRDFGKWQVPWGEVNRFQRIVSEIVQPFDDGKPSIPVPFTSARWGSLASFGARPYQGSKKWYGTTGNSFLAAVEFGEKVRAFAVTAGGQSGHPESPHFNDQAARYASGDLREVYFYPGQLKGHVERTYHPGE